MLRVAGNRLRNNVEEKKKNPAHSIVLKDTEIAKKRKKQKMPKFHCKNQV